MRKLALAITLLTVGGIKAAHTAEFFCPSGNVTCLIAAINEANLTSEEDRILLELGTYTLTTELPSITTAVVIERQFEGATLIEGDSFFGRFGFRVVETGELTINGMTLSRLFGAVSSSGTLRLVDSVITQNFFGPGILNAGTAFLIGSVVTGNVGSGSNLGAGGIINEGNLTILDSLISNNDSGFRGTGGIFNDGTLNISNSTITGNVGDFAGGIFNRGQLTISNSTISDNVAANFGVDHRFESDYHSTVHRTPLLNPLRLFKTDTSNKKAVERRIGPGVLTTVGFHSVTRPFTGARQ